MEPWRETQGYMIKTDDDVVLNYPSEQEEGIAVALISQEKETPNHWTTPISTGENMSVLVTTVSDSRVNAGDQIAAFSPDGRIAGVGMVDVEGRCGLAVWGDDNSTDEIDGLRKGEAFELRLWNAEKEAVLDVFPGIVMNGKGLVYETDAFTVLNATVETPIPDDFYLSEAYPNPFNAVTRLTYGLPEASHVIINVFDVTGRLVTTLVNGNKSSGHHTVVWESGNANSGIFLMKMESAGFSDVRKVALIR